ncbi:ParB N-terminal domain-containing protein [Murimonas intestini]|uniref:ParB N-terminal domain-containing protein n=1 Tax=Murimonas intestini TaxID=1337051 RepID=UPI0011DCB39D|nr:ParB N-terminal domain-containing protein [Murimonas intestini]
MSNYIELPINKIELDRSNPRIANFLDLYSEDEVNSDTMALLLGTVTESCASLRESIKENGGIIHPIIVNKNLDGRYVVIEGNTRLQIYRDFVKANIPGNWDYIKAIVYDDLNSDDKHSIRLQAHLIGPREWDPYSKAKYLNYLANEEHMPMNVLIAYCGGNTKASEIKHMILAYQDMQEFYRPLCKDDSIFNIKKFHGFVELQNRNVIDSLILHGYNKTNFSQWMVDEKFSKMEDVRKIPDILNSKKATAAFFREDSKAAKKILAVEEISSDSLKDVPYDLLAKELIKRMDDFKQKEIDLLRHDVDYAGKLSTLKDVIESVQFILDEVDR